VLTVLVARYERLQQELSRERAAGGKTALPDLEEEDRLREAIARHEADNARLASQLEALAHSVLGAR
jgi:hypothetical protein